MADESKSLPKVNGAGQTYAANSGKPAAASDADDKTAVYGAFSCYYYEIGGSPLSEGAKKELSGLLSAQSIPDSLGYFNMLSLANLLSDAGFGNARYDSSNLPEPTPAILNDLKKNMREYMNNRGFRSFGDAVVQLSRSFEKRNPELFRLVAKGGGQYLALLAGIKDPAKSSKVQKDILSMLNGNRRIIVFYEIDKGKVSNIYINEADRPLFSVLRAMLPDVQPAFRQIKFDDADCVSALSTFNAINNSPKLTEKEKESIRNAPGYKDYEKEIGKGKAGFAYLTKEFFVKYYAKYLESTALYNQQKIEIGQKPAASEEIYRAKDLPDAVLIKYSCIGKDPACKISNPDDNYLDPQGIRKAADIFSKNSSFKISSEITYSESEALNKIFKNIKDKKLKLSDDAAKAIEVIINAMNGSSDPITAEQRNALLNEAIGTNNFGNDKEMILSIINKLEPSKGGLSAANQTTLMNFASRLEKGGYPDLRIKTGDGRDLFAINLIERKELTGSDPEAIKLYNESFDILKGIAWGLSQKIPAQTPSKLADIKPDKKTWNKVTSNIRDNMDQIKQSQEISRDSVDIVAMLFLKAKVFPEKAQGLIDKHGKLLFIDAENNKKEAFEASQELLKAINELASDSVTPEFVNGYLKLYPTSLQHVLNMPSLNDGIRLTDEGTIGFNNEHVVIENGVQVTKKGYLLEDGVTVAATLEELIKKVIERDGKWETLSVCPGEKRSTIIAKRLLIQSIDTLKIGQIEREHYLKWVVALTPSKIWWVQTSVSFIAGALDRIDSKYISSTHKYTDDASIKSPDGGWLAGRADDAVMTYFENPLNRDMCASPYVRLLIMRNQDINGKAIKLESLYTDAGHNGGVLGAATKIDKRDIDNFIDQFVKKGNPDTKLRSLEENLNDWVKAKGMNEQGIVDFKKGWQALTDQLNTDAVSWKDVIRFDGNSNKVIVITDGITEGLKGLDKNAKIELYLQHKNNETYNPELNEKQVNALDMLSNVLLVTFSALGTISDIKDVSNISTPVSYADIKRVFQTRKNEKGAVIVNTYSYSKDVPKADDLPNPNIEKNNPVSHTTAVAFKESFGITTGMYVQFQELFANLAGDLIAAGNAYKAGNTVEGDRLINSLDMQTLSLYFTLLQYKWNPKAFKSLLAKYKNDPSGQAGACFALGVFVLQTTVLLLGKQGIWCDWRRARPRFPPSGRRSTSQ